MNWNFDINIANARQALTNLRSHFTGMFDEMASGITNNIMKFNAYQEALDYCVNAGKKLISESRELITISSKYDIPISKMGSLQIMAAKTGQSVGQLARGFRFLEMNVGRAMLKPGGPQDQALKELGVSQEQYTKMTEDTMYALDVVREKVMKIGDESRRNAFLQEMFGANWQSISPIIEAGATSQRDALTAGYEYTTGMTESLSGVADTMEEIAQDVKPIIMPFVQAFAMAATIFGMLIEGLKTMITLIGVALRDAMTIFVGSLQEAFGACLKLLGAIQKIVGFTSAGEKTQALGNDFAEVGKDGQKRGKSRFQESATKILGNGLNEQQKSSDRLSRQSSAFKESMGQSDHVVAKDGPLKGMTEYQVDVKNEIDKTNDKLGQQKIRVEKLKMEMAQLAVSQRAGLDVSEEMNKVQEKMTDNDREGVSLKAEKLRLQQAMDRSGYRKEADPNVKPRTNEERKIDLQRGRQGREHQIKGFMATTQMVAEMETFNDVIKSKMEIVKLEEDLQDLRKNEADNIQAIADMENSIINAKIDLMSKEKAHDLFKLKKQREMEDSEKERKDDNVKFMESREQQFMTRQGMTGMDKQSVSVSNAIEQMQRDQAQLNKVMNDPLRSSQEKLEAKKKFEGSTIGAQKEFDKLSLMQFQYSASDSAKKGMGGGIDVRENQLSVSKEQLDYLRKTFELQLKSFGLSPDQFGNVPYQMAGPLRGGK